MKIFIDSANTEEIKKYLDQGLCDGVTTNPTTFFKLGIKGEDIKKKVLEIANLINPLPLSVEVTSENPEEILTQAKEFSSWATNIVIKVTVTDSRGNSLLGVIKKLVQEGIVVNVTTVMTFNQSMLVAKAIKSGMKGAPRMPHCISIFVGRISEEYGVETARNVVEDAVGFINMHGFEGIEILIASIRNAENIEYFSKTGGHIMTVPPESLSKALVSARTKEGVATFLEDAKKSI